MPSTPFSWTHLNQWNVALVPSLLLVIAGVLYLAGQAGVAHWPRGRTVCFLLGLVTTFVATQSVIGVYDMALFSAHMAQHLLLLMVAGPLFAASAPIDLARHAGGERVRGALSRPGANFLLHPLVGFILYFVFIPATHLTTFFNLMLQHEWIHHAEQISFLVVGYLFFRPAFGIEEGVRLHPGLRLVYVMAAVPVDTFTGLALVMESKNPFPAYRAMTPSPHGSLLDSIHLGGAMMWIGGDSLMLLALIPLAVTWVRFETQRTRELDVQLDAVGR